MCIPEQFIGTLKKTDFYQPADNCSDARTTADYEALRNFVVEGGEASDNIGAEIAQFMTCGSAAWIRRQRESQTKNLAGRAGPMHRCIEGLLTVLLANMAES